MQTAQYWKPGEVKPQGGGEEGVRSSSSSDQFPARSSPNQHINRKGTHNENSHKKRERRGSSSGEPKKRDKKREGKGDKQNTTRGGAKESSSVSRGNSKAAASGPSQGLLAMKFMQRKVKVDEALQEQKDKREKQERDFSSSYAKRLKADKASKDRLACRQEEQDPALIVVGRRSFGGFNAVAEKAYNACIRDIKAEERSGQMRGEGQGREAGGISDAEMAERLGKNVRRGRR